MESIDHHHQLTDLRPPPLHHETLKVSIHHPTISFPLFPPSIFPPILPYSPSGPLSFPLPSMPPAAASPPFPFPFPSPLLPSFAHFILFSLPFLIFALLFDPSIGQKVNVTLFTESQCPFCTRLLREQIWQFHSRHPGIMNLQIIPFGKGNCEFTRDRRLICKCMHGPTECDLNRLQNCAISYFPRRHIGLVICIQGLKNLEDAYQRCLSRLSPRTQTRLKQCAQTQTGEVLNYYSMLNTHRAGVRIWPTAYVNGHFFDRSYPMEAKICEHTNWC